jgi:hypothetical protein
MKANAPLWIVSLGQGGGDSAAVGGPGAVTIVDPDPKGTVIAFTAGEEGAAGPTLAYGAYIEPEGPTVTVESDDPAVGGEVVLTNTEAFTDYVVTIYGVNIAGRGKSASTNSFQLNYNEVDFTGAVTVTDVDDYNDTGEAWKVAVMSGEATMTVNSGPKPFSIFMVGGGGGGGGVGPYYSCGGNGGAGSNIDSQESLALGVFTLNRPNGGNRACSGHPGGTGGNGQTAWIKDDEGTAVHEAAGGQGGKGGPGPPTGGSGQSFPNTSYKSDVEGAGEKTYGGNGGAGDCSNASDGQKCATSGRVGTNIIAWQVGYSSTKGIRRAKMQKEAAALEAARVTDHAYLAGMVDAYESHQAMADDLTDAIEAAAAADEAKSKRSRKKS